MACNLMTAVGCESVGNFFFIWIGLAILFLLVMMAKKWLGEENSAGMSYNWVGSMAAFPAYIIIAIIFVEAKWAILAGLGGMILGGFGLSRWSE